MLADDCMKPKGVPKESVMSSTCLSVCVCVNVGQRIAFLPRPKEVARLPFCQSSTSPVHRLLHHDRPVRGPETLKLRIPWHDLEDGRRTMRDDNERGLKTGVRLTLISKSRDQRSV